VFFTAFAMAISPVFNLVFHKNAYVRIEFSHESNPMKPRSGLVTDGMERAPARGMLRAVGMKDEDFLNHKLELHHLGMKSHHVTCH
jgi:hypothetical protein